LITNMSGLSEVFSYTAFVHAISGATGGSMAMTTFYPLDVIRTHMQVHHESILKLVKEEGIDVLYRGLKATLISLYVSNFVFFYANNLFKVLVRKYTQKEVTILQNLAISSMAGVVNVLLTCPLWVANTQLKLQSKKATSEQTYNGLQDCITKISKEKGPAALWSGVGASLVLVSNPTINHVVYDKVKIIFIKRAQLAGRKITPLEIFIAGAIAKTIATILTYPIQLAQSRQRHTGGQGGHSRPPQKDGPKTSSNKKGEEETKYNNMFHVLFKVYQADGILGWFSGLEVKILQTVLTAAFHFVCYEQIKSIIFQILSPREK